MKKQAIRIGLPVFFEHSIGSKRWIN